MQDAKHFLQVCVTKVYIYHCIDILVVGKEPCSLGPHHIGEGHYPFAEPESAQRKFSRALSRFSSVMRYVFSDSSMR